VNKAILTFTALLFYTVSVAQTIDTVNIRVFDRYWTQPRLVPKLGFGVQEVGFAEIGVQWHKIYIHPLSLASAGPYLTVDGIVNDGQFIMGPKAGYEITAGLIGIAADVTYYSDFKRDAWVFTPRAGVSVLGFVNLFYGRNISLSDYLFDEVDKNRFSLVFNLNRDYFNLKEARKKRER
jgi:hypothetical protein